MMLAAVRPLETPVLFIIFNRPETTAKVFEAIRRARPRQLFVAADGPRSHVDSDAERCHAARKLIADVDWDCEVKTLFRKHNLGCRVAVSSAITWFFQHVEQGIILEDDTLPVQSFFSYCQGLLERYKNTSQIMLVSGDNFQLGYRHGEASYYFSRYPHIWGWATWRRAWSLYSADRTALASMKKKKSLQKIFASTSTCSYWRTIFERTFRGEIDSWDYIWTLSIWNNNGISILPNVNMVKNIGFFADATHTKDDSKLGLLPVQELDALHHPETIAINDDADEFTQRYIFSGRIEFREALIWDIANALDTNCPVAQHRIWLNAF